MANVRIKNPFGDFSIGANQKWPTHFQFAQFRSKFLTNFPIFMTNFCNRFGSIIFQSIFYQFFITLVDFSQKFISNFKKQIFSNFLPIFFRPIQVNFRSDSFGLNLLKIHSELLRLEPIKNGQHISNLLNSGQNF